MKKEAGPVLKEGAAAQAALEAAQAKAVQGGKLEQASKVVLEAAKKAAAKVRGALHLSDALQPCQVLLARCLCTQQAATACKDLCGQSSTSHRHASPSCAPIAAYVGMRA